MPSERFGICRECGTECRGKMCGDCRREIICYMPTPAQIAEETAKIRATWTEEEHRIRHRKYTSEKKVYRYVGGR